MLDPLRFSPHRVVSIRNFDKADPAIQDVLTTALRAGELVEHSGNALQLKHAMFIISISAGPNQALGFQNSPTQVTVPKGIAKHATVIALPKLQGSWTREHLIQRLNQLADRVRTKVRIAFAPDALEVLHAFLEKGMSEDEVVQKAEEEILRTHRRSDRRIVITPEMVR